jgi:hypothetical protein
MIRTGSKLIPAIGLILILLISKIPASEIIFYSLPTEKVNTYLEQSLSRKIPNRKWISLNGEWQVKDPKSGNQIGKVNIPFCFSYQNEILLTKEFELSDYTKKLFFLNAEWINGWSEISINGRVIYSGSQNFLPLRLELPITFLKPQKNVIEIRIKPYHKDKKQVPSWTPINLPRISSGILSSIYLEIIPQFHTRKIDINSQISDSVVTLSGSISFSHPITKMGKSKILLRYHSSKKILFQEEIQITDSLSSENKIPEWETDLKILWSINKPENYWVEVVIDSVGKLLDVFRHPIALRSAQIRGNNFLLNGGELPIKGINYVYQTPDGNNLFDPDLIRQDLKMIKEKGFNAVRMVLHPLPEEFYRICDGLGLLCFQDLPLLFFNTDSTSLLKWESYYGYVKQLAEQYSSVVAGGVAYQMDGESKKHFAKLDQLLKSTNESGILKYISSINPNLQNNQIDFQLVDIFHRNTVEKELEHLNKKFAGFTYFPSAFSKPLSYRVDSTTITHGLGQIRNLIKKVDEEIVQGRIPGQFILTYSDFYLDFPSLQNGSQKNPELSQTGLVDLNRQPRHFFDNQEAEISDVPIITEARSVKSYLYILLGIANLFLFLYSYRRFTEFRHNVNYSLKKTHGFFVNLQERIIIPHGQSLLLIFVISLNGAIIWSSFFFYFRNNLILDYLLSLLFFTPETKLWISDLIWNQPLFLVIITFLHLVIFYGLAIFIKIFSLFGQSRVTFKQSIAVSAWSTVPFVFLLPFGIIFYNILISLKSYWIIIVVLLYFHIWVYLRWINGTRVLTERRHSRIFAFVTFLGVLTTAIVLIFYQYQINLFDHLRFLYHLYR